MKTYFKNLTLHELPVRQIAAFEQPYYAGAQCQRNERETRQATVQLCGFVQEIKLLQHQILYRNLCFCVPDTSSWYGNPEEMPIQSMTETLVVTRSQRVYRHGPTICFLPFR